MLDIILIGTIVIALINIILRNRKALSIKNKEQKRPFK